MFNRLISEPTLSHPGLYIDVVIGEIKSRDEGTRIADDWFVEVAMANEPKEPPRKNGHWREKFGGPSRFPRPWNAEVAALLHDCWPTEVFLREDANTTEIVLRFPVSSKRLPEEIQNKYFGHELSLSRAFDEVVWAAPEKGQHSFWSRLAKAGYDAYWSAWMHLLKVVYSEHLFPEGNKQEDVWLAELKASRRSRSSAGRRSELEVERKSFERRFNELLQWCTDLHELVKQCRQDELSTQDIERKVFQTITGQRHDHNVLSGKAFCWTQNRFDPVLYDPQTWTPKELACALLALERYSTIQAYDTVTRRIRAVVSSTELAKS